MAKQGWLGSIALAVGAGAGAAAAQFGLGYGLGVITWSPETGAATTADSIWLASLAWTLWIAANSTVIGAVAADRRSAGEIGAAPPRQGRPAGGKSGQPGVFATAMWRALLAVCAAIGALLSVGLVLSPARLAGRPDTSAPELIAAGYAVVGVTIGIVVAVCALACRAAAANVFVTGAWLWLLAAASVVADATIGRGRSALALEVWPIGNSGYFRNTFSYAGAILMLGTAAVIGAGAVWQGARRGDNRIGLVLSGAAGPLLVAAAYLLTIPKLVGITGDPQASASIVAPYALIAGLAGSGLLVTALSGRDASKRGRKAGASASPGEANTVQLQAQWPAVIRATPTDLGGDAKAPATSPAKKEPVSGTAKVPVARDPSEESTARIPTSPKKASGAAASFTSNTSSKRGQPGGAGDGRDAGKRRGRRR